jgi:hypothetical protein
MKTAPTSQTAPYPLRTPGNSFAIPSLLVYAPPPAIANPEDGFLPVVFDPELLSAAGRFRIQLLSTKIEKRNSDPKKPALRTPMSVRSGTGF